jgi:hypothetical protein
LFWSWETQVLLQLRRLFPQTQAPFWQVDPMPQTFPHAPQFCESLAIRLTHWPLQSVCPLAHEALPPDGFAQLATKSARPKHATSADKKGLRTVMIDSFN